MRLCLLGIFLYILFLHYKLSRKIPDKYTGTVITGWKKGRTFDWPTANLKNDGTFPCGAFQCTTQYGRATVISTPQVIEVHINNFHEDIYGKILELSDIHYLLHAPIFKYYTIGINLFR